MNAASLLLPLFVLAAVTLAFVRRKDVYSEFLTGADEGLKTAVSIFPPILGILTASAMLRSCGLLDAAVSLIRPFTSSVHIPDGAVLLALMRPMSGGGSLGILTDIINTYGADSITALTAAVMMGSTETTLYTLSVYFRNTSVRDTRRIAAAAFTADIICAAAAGIVSYHFFS